MNTLIKKTAEKILKPLTKAVLAKQQPQVITVTGSVGKTSTKQAICSVLADKFSVKGGAKNYNNELGVPFAILGLESPQKSINGWLKLFLKAVKLTLIKDKNYPEILVLEVGADKPGDLKYLMEMIPKGLFKVAVLTAVAPVHLEFFDSMENVFQEKITPFFSLAKDGLAVVAADNCDAERIKDTIHCTVITYGIRERADITIKGLKQNQNGLAFQLNNAGQTLDFFLPQGVYFHQVYPLLAAVAVGVSYKMTLRDISRGLAGYTPPPGRMRRIKGINKSLIIDDTYNSSPESCKRALEALTTIPQAQRKIAVLGDMLELGETSEEFHKTIGQMASRLKIDYLITYGQMAQFMAKASRENGLAKERVYSFTELEKITDFLKKFIQPGDVLLIKGSQGMRMEKIVKTIMQEPKKAKALLVRQNQEWL